MDAEVLRQVRLEHDAARWRQLQKNPFAAVNALLANCNPSRPIEWPEKADLALDRLASGYYNTGYYKKGREDRANNQNFSGVFNDKEI